MTEFKLIKKFIDRVKIDNTVAVGIGDDAAILNVPEGFQIVQTMDTMVKGVHFDERFSADALAHKILHVNLSDIAAMAATAQWATVALTMPFTTMPSASAQLDQADLDEKCLYEKWLDEFSAGLQSRSADMGLNLVGGDTTSGSLSVTMNVTGIVETGKYLTRSGAQIGDDVYVSGYLGDAALALTEKGYAEPALLERLFYPQARLALGAQLYGLATACVDISDGLLADLGHICENSQVNAHINVETVPLSKAYYSYFSDQYGFEFSNKNSHLDYALNGGDDYELCFTAKPSKRHAIEDIQKKLDIPITRVGHIFQKQDERQGNDEQIESVSNNSSVSTILNGEPYTCQRVGWQHFMQS